MDYICLSFVFSSFKHALLGRDKMMAADDYPVYLPREALALVLQYDLCHPVSSLLSLSLKYSPSDFTLCFMTHINNFRTHRDFH